MIDPQFSQRPGDFSEGFAIYPRSGLSGIQNYRYLTRVGKFAFAEKSFLYGFDFRFGFARVALRRGLDSRNTSPVFHWGWVDKQGKVYDFDEPAIPIDKNPESLMIREGMVPSPSIDSEGDLKWGFRNLSGAWVIQPLYFSVRPFYFEKAFVQISEGSGVWLRDHFILVAKNGNRVLDQITFQDILAPNHTGLGVVRIVPLPGETEVKSYLFHWKKNQFSQSIISSSDWQDPPWEFDWISGGEWVQDPDGILRFQAGYYDENFNLILGETAEGFRIMKAYPFFEGFAFVEFYKRGEKKINSKKGLIDRSGKLRFYFEDGKVGFPPLRFGSERILVTKVR